MIGGTKNQTPNVACTTDATANRIVVATSDASIKWKDVNISCNTNVTWRCYNGAGQALAAANNTLLITTDIIAGDYIQLTYPVTISNNVKATLRYIPTNSLLGSWTVNV
jgi:hypothetical protein